MKDNPRKAQSPQGNPEPPSFTAVAEVRPEAFFIIAQGELDLTTADICAVLFNQIMHIVTRPEEVQADLPLVGHLGPVPGEPARLPEGVGPRGQSYFSRT